MNLLEVIPIAKGIPFDTLTYLYNEEADLGQVVNIDIGGRKAKAIVLGSKSAQDSKASIRSVNYKLKKIDSVSDIDCYKFSDNFVKSLLACAHYYLMTPGKVLSYMIPSDFIEHTLSHKFAASSSSDNLIQDNLAANSINYNFIYYPTIEEVNSAYEVIMADKNNSSKVYKLHSEVTVTQKRKVFQALFESRAQSSSDMSGSQVTIISTPNIIPSILVGKVDLKSITVKIMNINSGHYYHPYFDFNLLDIMQNSFTMNKVNFEAVQNVYNLKKVNVIDMEEESNVHNNDYLLSRQALNAIANLQRSSKANADLELPNSENTKSKIIIYTTRRGLSPTSICEDCGMMVKCDACSSPMALHQTSNGQRKYKCHKCESSGRISEIIVNSERELLCKGCGGWRIHLRGISTHMIASTLAKYGVPTYITDSDTANTKKKLLGIVNGWLDAPAGILITNDISLPALESKASDIKSSQNIQVIIPSLDGLLSMPEYTINYKILNILSTLSTISNNKVILQSRNIKNTIIGFVQKDKVNEFLEMDTISRKMAELPPDYVIVKFNYNKDYDKASKSFTDHMTPQMQKRLSEFLSPLHIYWYSTYAHIFIKKDDYTPNVQDKLYISLSNFNPIVNPSLLHG